MPQVIITFVPSEHVGQYQLTMKVPRDLSVRDVHKALCMLVSNIGEQNIADERAPLVQVPQPEIQTPWQDAMAKGRE